MISSAFSFFARRLYKQPNDASRADAGPAILDAGQPAHRRAGAPAGKSRASIRVVFACLALLGMLAGLSAPVLADNVETNTDRPGGDLGKPIKLKPLTGSIAGGVEQQCQSRCAANASCKAWTLVKAGVQDKDALCWLKGSIPAKRSDACCTSAIANRDTFGEFETNVDRPGSDYTPAFSVASPQECQKACGRNSMCQAWTWVKPGVQGANPQCYLKNDVPAPVKADCCTSGVKGIKLN